VILKVNETDTRSSSQLLEAVGRQRPGDKVSILVDRSGKELSFDVVLRNQDGDTRIVTREEKGVLELMGVELEEVNEATARKLDISGGLKVTRLTQGILKKSTDMKPGFIITGVDGKDPGTVDQFTRYLEKTEGGVMLEGVYEDLPGKYYYAFGL